VRAAIVNCGFEFPARRITVNLAPAELPKESGRFDLAIALGTLAGSGQIPSDQLDGYQFAGELSLIGALRPVRGALAMAYGAASDQRVFVLPTASAGEAALVSGTAVLQAASLLETCAHLCGRAVLQAPTVSPCERADNYPDMDDVRGQSHAKRALEVAAAGGHALLMAGSPGTGKSMLAARLPGLLPPLSDAEGLQTAAVQSLGSAGFQAADWKRRPFCAPHHSASSVAIVGGSSEPRPGEISLAHHGVLFLDELPEFDRRVLESLREPLETGRVAISRAARQVEYPACFQLVAAMNPCPCGFLGHFNGRCRCTPDQVARYRSRTSGLLLDRIDIQIEVPAVPVDELMPGSAADAATQNRVRGGANGGAETTHAVRERVLQARARMLARQGCANTQLATRAIERHCTPEDAGARLLRQAGTRLGLSARGYHRVLKLARTIADLAAAPRVAAVHVAEAVQLRRMVPPDQSRNA